MLKDYYYLAKPGIVRGNLVTAAGGFFLASYGNVNLRLLLATLLGTAFIIASSCVFNNILDLKIDSKMKRTETRALVTGRISKQNAAIYGTILLFIGIFTLFYFTNTLATLVALTGLVFYVAVYGYFKRMTVHGTLIGSIAGAIPPVIGYTAVTNTIDLGAILLFLVLVTWQMPHFYAIAIYSIDEYKNAGLPMLPVVKGIKAAKIQILVYIILFMISVSLLTLFAYTKFIYLLVMLVVSSIWLSKALSGFEAKNDEIWARGVFSFSLVTLAVFSILISVDFALQF